MTLGYQVGLLLHDLKGLAVQAVCFCSLRGLVASELQELCRAKSSQDLGTTEERAAGERTS